MEALEKPGGAPPNQTETHTCSEVKIKEVMDGKGTSLKDGANEYDPRQFAVSGSTPSKIEYELKNEPGRVIIRIVVDGNKIAADYYPSPAVAVWIEEKEVASHTVEWNGRDQYSGDRLILQGSYKIEAEAICGVCQEKSEPDSVALKVRKPYAQSFGGFYAEIQASWSDTNARRRSTAPWWKFWDRVYREGGDPWSQHGAAVLPAEIASLSDGSEFDTHNYDNLTKGQCLNELETRASVWYWMGHAGPGVLEVTVPPHDVIRSSDIEQMAEDSLLDVFLAVLFACNTAGTPQGGKSLPEVLTLKGVDIVVSFDDKVKIFTYPHWTRYFLSELKAGRGVLLATRLATMKIKRQYGSPFYEPLEKCRIKTGSGASQNDTLTPARCGRAV